MSDNATILHPVVPEGPEGGPRRVGIEIAFAGLDLDDAVQHVIAHFGGEAREIAPGCIAIGGTEVGSFTVRHDAPVGSQDAPDHAPDHEPTRTRGQTRDASAKIAHFATAGADRLPPLEISCPRVPYDRLAIMETFLDALRREGTPAEDSPLAYAIGLELEAEAASLDTAQITLVLKAYLLMSDWLRKDTPSDNLSDVLPVPARFPMAYRRRVADPDYAPRGEALLRDYVAFNPTRDRELDLYPLFVQVFGERPEIREALGNAMPRARPVYRYRLPRGAVERGGGRVTDEWNRWVRIEQLAADKARLDDMGRAFVARAGDFVRGDWADESERWLTR